MSDGEVANVFSVDREAGWQEIVGLSKLVEVKTGVEDVRTGVDYVKTGVVSTEEIQGLGIPNIGDVVVREGVGVGSARPKTGVGVND